MLCGNPGNRAYGQAVGSLQIEYTVAAISIGPGPAICSQQQRITTLVRRVCDSYSVCIDAGSACILNNLHRVHFTHGEATLRIRYHAAIKSITLVAGLGLKFKIRCIKATAHGQRAAVSDSCAAQHMRYTTCHLQNADSYVGNGIGNPRHPDFQRTTIERDQTCAESIFMPGNQLATVHHRAARVAVSTAHGNVAAAHFKRAAASQHRRNGAGVIACSRAHSGVIYRTAQRRFLSDDNAAAIRIHSDVLVHRQCTAVHNDLTQLFLMLCGNPGNRAYGQAVGSLQIEYTVAAISIGPGPAICSQQQRITTLVRRVCDSYSVCIDAGSACILNNLHRVHFTHGEATLRIRYHAAIKSITLVAGLGLKFKIRCIKATAHGQRAAVSDSSVAQLIRHITCHLQCAGADIGDGIGNALHPDFQGSSVERDCTCTQRLSIIGDQHAALDFCATRVTVSTAHGNVAATHSKRAAATHHRRYLTGVAPLSRAHGGIINRATQLGGLRDNNAAAIRIHSDVLVHRQCTAVHNDLIQLFLMLCGNPGNRAYGQAVGSLQIEYTVAAISIGPGITIRFQHQGIAAGMGVMQNCGNVIDRGSAINNLHLIGHSHSKTTLIGSNNAAIQGITLIRALSLIIQIAGIKAAAHRQRAAVADSTGQHMRDSGRSPQRAGASVGNTVGKVRCTNFQRATVEHNSPRSQRGSSSSHHRAALYRSAADVIILRVDTQCACSLLGEGHTARQLTPGRAVGIPGVILLAVHQHGGRSERTHQRHFAGAFIAEYDTDAIIVCIVDVMLLPVDGAVHIPQAVVRLVIPCCFREGGKVEVECVIHPAEVIDGPYPAAHGDIACPVGRRTHPAEQHVAAGGVQPLSRIQPQGNGSPQSQGAAIQRQCGGGGMRGGNIDDKGATGRQSQCAVHRRIPSAEA